MATCTSRCRTGREFVDQDGNANSSTKWHDWFAIQPTEQVRIGDLDGDQKDDFFTFLPAPIAQCYTVQSLGTSMGPNVLWPEPVAPLSTDMPFVGRRERRRQGGRHRLRAGRGKGVRLAGAVASDTRRARKKTRAGRAERANSLETGRLRPARLHSARRLTDASSPAMRTVRSPFPPAEILDAEFPRSLLVTAGRRLSRLALLAIPSRARCGWNDGPPMITSRWGFTMTPLVDGRLLVAGAPPGPSRPHRCARSSTREHALGARPAH